MRRITIFGATGSIGENTVDLITRAGGAEAFDVVALSGGRNVARLAEQARELRADLAVTAFDDCYAATAWAAAGSGSAMATSWAPAVWATARAWTWPIRPAPRMANRTDMSSS